MCNEYVREQWNSTLENVSDEIRGICKYYSMAMHTHSSSTKVFSINNEVCISDEGYMEPDNSLSVL